VLGLGHKFPQLILSTIGGSVVDKHQLARHAV